MSMFECFNILPTDYEGSIQYKIITVRVSASTTEDEYRCRDMDTYSIVVYDDEDRLIYHYSTDYRDSPQKKESVIDEEVGLQLSGIFSFGCQYGKYPEIEISLDNLYYTIVDESEDGDRGRGYISAEYEFKVHICK